MIDDLEVMAKELIQLYCDYRANVEKKGQYKPKRIIFYRDGVSEGQFQHVLDIGEFRLPTSRDHPTLTCYDRLYPELPQLKRAQVLIPCMQMEADFRC